MAKIEDFPESVQTQIRKELAAKSVAPIHPDSERESDLQAACELVLEHLGYVRLTPANMVKFADQPIPGWFAHIVEARKNPCYPDLMIFSRAMGFCLPIELKTAKGELSPHQKKMVNNGRWAIARTVEKFQELVRWWCCNRTREG